MMIKERVKGAVAHVHEDKTEYIVLNRSEGDRVPLKMNEQLADSMSRLADFQRLVEPVGEVLGFALEHLTKHFSDRVSAVAKQPCLHDGQVVLTVRPRNSVFDINLSRDLNNFSWDLQDKLCELTGEDVPPVLFGFRQEISGGEKQD